MLYHAMRNMIHLMHFLWSDRFDLMIKLLTFLGMHSKLQSVLIFNFDSVPISKSPYIILQINLKMY